MNNWNHIYNLLTQKIFLIGEKIYWVILLFSLLIVQHCKTQSDNQSLWVESLVLPRIEWKTLFSYPGRDVDIIRQESVRSKIIEIIRDTKEELWIYIYGLADPLIVEEIQKAMQRGVMLRIITDKERTYELLESKRIPHETWKGSGLHHPKFILSDGFRLFTGTGNFTTQGLLKDFDSYFYTYLPEKSQALPLRSLLEEKGDPMIDLGGMWFIDSPRSGLHIQKRILDSIHSAKKNIRYMIYTHFDPLISQELIFAAKRGIHVEGIYNRPINPEGVRLSKILPIYGSRIYEEENEDRIDNGSFGLGGLLHHKTMIIDDRILLTGSYNYSRNARDFNREVFQITTIPYLVEENLREFYRVRSRSGIFRENKDDNLIEASPNTLTNSFSRGMSDSMDTGDIFLEWGEGIFRSRGLVRGVGLDSLPDSWDNISFHPLSSGIFSFPRSERKDMALTNIHWYDSKANPIRLGDGEVSFFGQRDSEKIQNVWKEISNQSIWNRLDIASWNIRREGGIELRLSHNGRLESGEVNNELNHGEIYFWTNSGEMNPGNLERRSDNVYFATWEEGLEELKRETVGFLFFRNKLGQWGDFACFQLGERRELPSSYMFFLKEVKINREVKPKSKDVSKCSVLGRSG